MGVVVGVPGKVLWLVLWPVRARGMFGTSSWTRRDAKELKVGLLRLCRLQRDSVQRGGLTLGTARGEGSQACNLV